MQIVDVVILSRNSGPLPALVERGLACQAVARVQLHRVIGGPQPGDRHRWETIARQRNRGKRLGTAPYLMFLDDDVELKPDTISRLVAELEAKREYGALAADYRGGFDSLPARHVAMGATLFRRRVLSLFEFRWEPGRCECQCCCDDLRRHAVGIAYCPGLQAIHHSGAVDRSRDDAPDGSLPPEIQNGACPTHPAETKRNAESAPGVVLAAFDRRHEPKFRRQFLDSLRRFGNCERVYAATYGLYPSEVARLGRLPGVSVVNHVPSRVLPAMRRLHEFQAIVAGLPPEAPVAYWDAADVFFQSRLEPLWQLIRANPTRLLAVREPRGYPENVAVSAWSLSIADPTWRDRCFGLMRERPFLNGGFAGGTAETMLHYFREADRMRHGEELRGSTDWGDQMALNLYCHLDPARWLEVGPEWNYCVHDRPVGEIGVGPDGRVFCRSGRPIAVVHGNAHSFRQFELSGLRRFA